MKTLPGEGSVAEGRSLKLRTWEGSESFHLTCISDLREHAGEVSGDAMAYECVMKEK